MSAPGIRWRAAPGLRLCRWPGEESCACFHAPSGDLHLLEAAAGRLLAWLLEDGPQPAASLARRLEADFAAEPGLDVAAWTEACLQRLARLHLVHRLPG
ncbi:MAG: HPr-rel-A system PqqD family peptide chaperone [Gammaproteobacteria bacterium]|nr:MAG: HPr-rel-A system PqqD family peptide chaperone [Gammaproteobacteria bacterium]